MSTQVRDPNPPQNADEGDENLYVALKDDLQHEIAHIKHPEEPIDTAQSDVLVQKHFDGLFITLLVFVVIVLGAAIAGIAIYTHH
jgi:hypothetical protein